MPPINLNSSSSSQYCNSENRIARLNASTSSFPSAVSRQLFITTALFQHILSFLSIQTYIGMQRVSKSFLSMDPSRQIHLSPVKVWMNFHRSIYISFPNFPKSIITSRTLTSSPIYEVDPNCISENQYCAKLYVLLQNIDKIITPEQELQLSLPAYRHFINIDQSNKVTGNYILPPLINVKKLKLLNGVDFHHPRILNSLFQGVSSLTYCQDLVHNTEIDFIKEMIPGLSHLTMQVATHTDIFKDIEAPRLTSLTYIGTRTRYSPLDVKPLPAEEIFPIDLLKFWLNKAPNLTKFKYSLNSMYMNFLDGFKDGETFKEFALSMTEVLVMKGMDSWDKAAMPQEYEDHHEDHLLELANGLSKCYCELQTQNPYDVHMNTRDKTIITVIEDLTTTLGEYTEQRQKAQNTKNNVFQSEPLTLDFCQPMQKTTKDNERQELQTLKEKFSSNPYVRIKITKD